MMPTPTKSWTCADKVSKQWFSILKKYGIESQKQFSPFNKVKSFR
jgi:hypothetical protein